MASVQRIVREIRGLRAQKWGNKAGYLFVLPALVLYLVFNAWPIVRGILMAFQDYRFLIPETTGLFTAFNGLDNYREMLGDQKFWQSLYTSVKFTAMLVPADVLLAFVVALILANLGEGRLVTAHRVIVYLPVVLPIAAAMLVWKQLYHEQFGYLNVLISKIAGRSIEVPWLSSVEWALPSAVIATLWKGFGYNTMLFLIGMYNINRELYEAAALDGAGAFQTVWSITIPLLKPILTLVLVLSAGIFSATEQMMILTRGGPAESTLTLGLYLYRVAFTWGDMRMGYAAAMNLVVGIISMLLAAGVFRLLRSEGD